MSDTATLEAPVKAPYDPIAQAALMRQAKVKRQQLRKQGLQEPPSKRVAQDISNGNDSTGAFKTPAKQRRCPNLETRAGRAQVAKDVIRAFYDGSARPPEVIQACRHLSDTYGDKEAIEAEKAQPRPESIAGWLARSSLQGRTVADSLGPDGFKRAARALMSALGVDALAITWHGVTYTVGKGSQSAQSIPPVAVQPAITDAPQAQSAQVP